MSQIDFMMGIHEHQPIGNFGRVFESVYERCYRPQIDVLTDHPGVRISLHHSGPLLEWIESNRPGYLDDVAMMAERGQVEILSGGFYEPILSSIPEDDAIGQVVMMNEYIQKRFGQTPAGMWMTERIWDPNMPKVIAKAGLKYTLLDDTHFYYSGIELKDMFGYYMTEKHGYTVAVFPIDKNLRYKIPFSQPHETIDYLKYLKDELKVNGATYGDDGEKYGEWPDTYKWVYEDKWLHKFYSALEENQETIRTTLFSCFIDENRSMGRIYLPMASYEEMMEWTLSAESGKRFHRMLDELDRSGKRDEYKPFIRGGVWDNFLAKYDESNQLHKKMLYVSGKITDAQKGGTAPSVIEKAKRELYKGQCNCAYWHGLFGGLYLNYLRHALYERLINAENILDEGLRKTDRWLDVKQVDIDADGAIEPLIENPVVNVYLDPDYGGSMMRFDYRPALFSLTNTLTRAPEVYHDKILPVSSESAEESAQPASIHDVVHMKEDGLADMLRYDHHLRRCFQDIVVDKNVTLEKFRDIDYDERGDFADGVYEIKNINENKNEVTITLRRDGSIRSGGNPLPVTVEKTFCVNDADALVTAFYTITNSGEKNLDMTLGTEFNLTLLAAREANRYWVLENSAERPMLCADGESVNATKIGMRDDWNNFMVVIECDAPSDIFRTSVETVSQSESGFEKTYQGSSIVFFRALTLAPGESINFSYRLSVEKTI